MSTHISPCSGPCPLSMERRHFLAAAGASALSLKMGAFAWAAPSPERTNQLSMRARIRAVFVRPDKERYFLSWPGASYDPDKSQLDYIRTLADAAKKLNVDLDVRPVPVHEPESISSMLEQLKQQPVDGLVITVMHLQSWPQAEHLLKYRGDVPAIVFSPLGTSLTQQQATRRLPKTFVGATQDHSWLTTALRMLRTVFDMKQARICICTDAARGDRQLQPLGTTLHFVPLARWIEEVRRTELTEEMQEMAQHYAIESKTITEPEKEDLLNAAKNYLAARRLMAAEKCQGISVDCSPLVDGRQVPCGPCLAWSRLLDEGSVGACEADADAAISLLLVGRLCDRPGFMQDPAANTVNNTLIGSHCTCATKLRGFDRPAAPFALRSHFESNTGVALRVLWEPGQEVTIMKFQGPEKMLLGTGRVVSNVDSSSGGGCRTAVEIKLDAPADARDVKGHHQIFVAGKLDTLLKAYCELSGITIEQV